VAVDVGEAEITSLELVGELFVVDPELVENGGVEVVDVNRVFRDIIRKIIGSPMRHTGFDATARHPDSESARVVVPPVVILGKRPLAVGGATKLTTPDNECIVEEAALFEIPYEGR